MAFDSLGRYAPTHKGWDHVGNILPNVEYSEGVRPHGGFKPAAWLPVQLLDKYYEVWYVATPGKIIAADNQGRLVPAQYGLAGASITYTASDVEAGVLDVRTGATLLANDTGTFAVSGVTDFMGTGETFAVSAPLGVAPYGYFQWAGDGSEFDDGFTPAGFREHNHSLQHQVALLCDYVLELPLVPATATAEELVQDSHSGSRAVLVAVGNLPVATSTLRTAITFGNSGLTDAATRFVREVGSVAEVTSAGDWHINYQTGVITVFASVTLGGGNVYTITYSHYASAPASVSKFATAVGNLKAGDFVKCDANSNFVIATSEDFKEVMGQVLEVENLLDKDALGRVRTAYDNLSSSAAGSKPGYPGQMDQMPGSANGGVPGNIHYAGAADLVVRVNLVSR